MFTSVVQTPDDAFVMSGSTNGSYGGSTSGGEDLVAIKMDANGTVLWTWQVTVTSSATCETNRMKPAPLGRNMLRGTNGGDIVTPSF